MAESAARDAARGYLQVLTRVLRELDLDAVIGVAALLQRARAVGGTIYLAGNGGSAATASHWANDLGKATRRADSPPVRVVSLCDQLSWLTALANDEGYDRVFAGQIEGRAQPGDVLVVFSASGNSPNLIAAVRAARLGGAHTVAVLGFDGGRLKGLADDVVWLPTPHGAYGQAEDAHMVVCHLITAYLAAAHDETAQGVAVSVRGS